MDRKQVGVPTALLLDGAVILGTVVVATLVVLALDLDIGIAKALQGRGDGTVDEYTNLLASYSFAVAALCVAWLSIPGLRRGYPLVSRCSGVFVMTLIIAVLGFVQNLKIERDRPRPSEVIQFGGRYTYKPPFGDEKCSCKSFPSSAAGFGFLLATPFFVLRRQRPLIARSFLAAGLMWGSYIGYGRMLANKHWITDIMWSAALVLMTASVLASIQASWRSEDQSAR